MCWVKGHYEIWSSFVDHRDPIHFHVLLQFFIVPVSNRAERRKVMNLNSFIKHTYTVDIVTSV